MHRPLREGKEWERGTHLGFLGLFFLEEDPTQDSSWEERLGCRSIFWQRTFSLAEMALGRVSREESAITRLSQPLSSRWAGGLVVMETPEGGEEERFSTIGNICGRRVREGGNVFAGIPQHMSVFRFR
ncbi:hypothetical protein CDAR_615481 [Caerostris darwini]|uniref:Uncharacterized protein n=1 Tax=Caerostris darwini TaxID=1538125 RepID=A0AAV4RV00_9ARAC|nr:hypothetical protein CDAR_615481 [Caerostris darwini]